MPDDYGYKQEVPCDHPYDQLSILSTATTRGTSGVVRVSCRKCGKYMPGAEGLVQFMSGVRDRMVEVAKAVQEIGGDLPDLAIDRRQPDDLKKRKCLHYLSWLVIEADRSSQRGYSASKQVRCRNCGLGWPDHAELLVAMKRELEAMWKVVQNLGGERKW